MNWHVTPINDLKPHEESTTCHCEPRVEHVNGNMVIIHNSFDGREGIEIANELLATPPLQPTGQVIGEWVSVEDGLPEKGIEVLVFVQFSIKSKLAILHRMKHTGTWFDYNDSITHWQPLPTPPTTTTASKGGEEK